MKKFKPKYCVGQMIRHRLFGYFGLVMGVDAEFSLSEEWYQKMARSNPPKDEPWYHVRIHGEDSLRYVAERNINLDKNIFN